MGREPQDKDVYLCRKTRWRDGGGGGGGELVVRALCVLAQWTEQYGENKGE